jgi:hypothetical protein
MSCEHYWRDGVLLVEHGEPDPHRETCVECRRAHEARAQLVGALPAVAETRTGDPGWQMRVWGRIAREEGSRARRSYWVAGGLVAAAAVVILALRIVPLGGDHPVDNPVAVARPAFEIVPGLVAMRSASARVGDRIRIPVDPAREVRVYRANDLVLRCSAGAVSPGCIRDRQDTVGEVTLATAGEYQLIAIFAVTAEPVGTLDRDLAAVVSAGGDYKMIVELSVR